MGIRDRPTWSLDKDMPLPRAVGTIGHIHCRLILDRLYNQYVQI
jgi:hypothetical protein